VRTDRPIVRGPFAGTHADILHEYDESVEWLWRDARWRGGVLAVLAGHLGIMLFPAEVLVWNRSPARLLVLEAAMLAAGVLAVAGLAAMLRHNIARWRARPRTAHVESSVLALATLAMASGLCLAVLDRWASSWAAIAWPYYLASVISVNPDVALVAGMPYVVRLHVASALALTTILPFTTASALVLVPLSRAVERLRVRVGFSH
jgi:nitrate reductase gamma subunit